MENLIKLTVDNLCDKFRNEVLSLQIWPKTISLCQAEQDKAYGEPLVSH